MTRVVITGIGIISPLGIGLPQNWTNLINGKSGLVSVEFSKFPKISCKVGGKIPLDVGSNESLKTLILKDKNLQSKSLTLSSIYAMIAANEALADANLLDQRDKIHAGVSIGCGMVSMEEIGIAFQSLQEKPSSPRLSPYFMPKILSNMAAGHVSMVHMLRGPNHSPSTACATGLHALGDGYLLIKQGLAEVMVCGGTEAPLYPLAFVGFGASRALSTTHNQDPPSASRPFDCLRDGFVPSEGAAILVLERLGHALERRRPRHIYAEVTGFGSSGDAHHVTAPSPDPRGGAYRCMKSALTQAAGPVTSPQFARGGGLEGVARALRVAYINAHATSTPAGDSSELRAIDTLLSDIKEREGDPNSNLDSSKVMISSTKGATGHMLGAAGSAEAAFTAMALHRAILPYNLNLNKPDYNPTLVHTERGFENANFVLPTERPAKLSLSSCGTGKKLVVLTNSFGFGGTNASLCLTPYIEEQ